MTNNMKIDISSRAIIKVVAVLALLYFLFYIREVLVLIFISIILVAAFGPVVKKWSTKIGKPLSIVALILILLAAIAGVFYLIVPPLVDQIRQFSQSLPNLVDQISIIRSHFPWLEKGFSSLTQSLGNVTGSFISITTSVFSAVVAFFTVLVLTVYLLIDEQAFTKFFSKVVPEDRSKDFASLIDKISSKAGSWLRGQLLLCLIIGVVAYIGLSIIGVKYALTLAVISGILEIIPIIGPIVSGTLAAIVSLAISPLTALVVVIFYILLQQLENNLIVPKIMEKAVGLPPAIIIIAILIGSKIIGITGALLAVPVVAILYVLFQEWTTVRKLISRE
jgi:predicted PurR-regulated permease PerM